MRGAAVSDWLSYIGPLVALGGFILTIWWKVEGKITAASEKAEKASADLAKHELHVAQTYATKADLQEQTAQLLRAIESVAQRIDAMNERLDRAFEQRTATRRSA